MTLKRTTTKTELVNLALALIGESPIEDLDDTNDAAAVAAAAVLDQVIVEVQADFPWEELLMARLLTADDAYAPEVSDVYAYRFELPDDYICASRDVRGHVVTDAAGNALSYYLANGCVYSTAESVVLNYVRESDYPAEWQPWMVQAVYHKLAAILAPMRNKSATLTERLINVYERIVRPRIRQQASSKRSSERPVRRAVNRYHRAGRGF